MSTDNDKSTPSIENEMERILNLSEFELDYTELEKYLQDLTNLASKVTNSKISLVNLIDSYTQWSVSSTGIDVDQMPREDSVCQYTIADGVNGFEVRNLEDDERFKDKSYVKGDPNLRYYYGIPLKTKNGNNIGALCVLDTEPKHLDPEKKELLKLIANEVVHRLEFLKVNSQLREQLQDMKENQKKVSHDIRNPLSGIIGLAGILEEELDPEVSSNLLEIAVMIKQSGESLLDLADQIMMSKSEQDNEDEGYGCTELIKKLKKLYMPQATNKKLDLTFNCDSTFNLNFPKNKLIQIVGNLISNSIKFTEENGTVDVRIVHQTLENEANKLHIEVQDSGIGMDEETIHNILNENTESKQGTAGESGFGYGLNLVQHLVRKAGGEMNIESEAGDGCTTTIHLPYKA